jgi:hypothetical protein
MTGIEIDGARSIAKSDTSVGIRRRFLQRFLQPDRSAPTVGSSV